MVWNGPDWIGKWGTIGGPVHHAVAMHGMRPLGVECRSCGHRGLVPAKSLGACDGSMTPLATFNFVCTLCGARAFDLFPFNGDEADTWVTTAADPADPAF